MLFSSLFFVCFLPMVLFLYYIVFIKSIRLQKIASIFFYAWGEPKFVLVMMFPGDGSFVEV